MSVQTLAWVLLAQTVGGLTPALSKLALAGIGPFGLVVARQALGGVLLLALLQAQRRRALGSGKRESGATRSRAPTLAFTRRDWLLLIAVAWAGFALPQVLNALGLVLSSATHGALLTPLEPIGILAGGMLLLGERPSAARLAAVVLAGTGAVLIVWPDAQSAGSASASWGDLLMAAGHLSWAIYTLAAKPLLERHDPLRVAVWACWLSILPLVPFAASEPVDPARLLPALGWVALLAVMATTLGMYAWNRALQRISASTMAAFIFVQPLVGLAAGALLGETLGAFALAGAGLIVAGVWIAALRGET